MNHIFVEKLTTIWCIRSLLIHFHFSMFDKENDIFSLHSLPDALCNISEFICELLRPFFPYFWVDMFNKCIYSMASLFPLLIILYT